jgi:hypothetical protein
VLRADQDTAAAEVQFSRFASFYQGDARTIAPLFARKSPPAAGPQ